MRTDRLRPLAIILSFSAAGCATIQRGAGFDDVQQLVSKRTPAEIVWTSEMDAESLVAERVLELLARPLTATSAVQIALLNDRRLQAVYARLGLAQADIVQAALPPNPIFSADVHPGIGASGLGVELGLVQEFISVLQIPLRKRIAEAAFEQAKLEVAEAVWDNATATKAAYYRLVGALQMLDLRRTVVQATTLSADLAKRRHDAGNLTDLELAREQALDDEARLQLAEAETEVAGEREDLNVHMGLWGDATNWAVPDRLADLPEGDPPPAGLESQAMQQRLDLAAARQELDVLARTVDFTGLYRFLPVGEAGMSAHREPEGGFWSAGPQISIPIPLFDRRQATLASDLARLRQSQDRYAALAVEIRSQVRRWRTKMLSARRRAEYYRRVALPRRTRVLDETQKQYNAMQVDAFELLQAKRDGVEAARRYIEAATEYWVGRTELERALGAELQGKDGAPVPVPEAHPEAPAMQHHHGG